MKPNSVQLNILAVLEMTSRYFLEIKYDGSTYHGWQVQPNSITVQERINIALSTILSENINVVGAGRTDTGVHATQMYAHFDSSQWFDLTKIVFRLNSFLENEISIVNIYKVIKNAHARFDAISRTYSYKIHYHKNPFLINKSWMIHSKLDIDKMNEAASVLLDYSDFTSFSKLHTQTRTNNCSVSFAHWKETPDSLVFKIKADRFLRNMVRAIVGTLVDIGSHKISIEDFINIINSKDRNRAGLSVPAHGLYLTEITYPKALFNE